MLTIDAEAVHKQLDYTSLVERLRLMFNVGCSLPPRQHYTVPVTDQIPDGTLLLMPAWIPNRHVGIKLVTVFPGNAKFSLPSVIGSYLLLDGRTGMPRAMIDGVALTLRRTAAASALAAGFLARHDAETLLMVGAGALAPHLVAAHAAVRPVRRVLLWNRDLAKAETLQKKLARQLPQASVAATADLEKAARQADIISCATLSKTPLIKGEWLKTGVHVDLVGGFTPEMREADDLAVRKARVFVDTRTGGLKEAGDIVDPIKRGIIREADVLADLFDLCRGKVRGRLLPEEITLFKSVGTALEDLAAAELVVERVEPKRA